MSKKTEEKDVCVPVAELEKELSSVVQKLMSELRKAHSRNTAIAKQLQSTEQRLLQMRIETEIDVKRMLLEKTELLEKNESMRSMLEKAKKSFEQQMSCIKKRENILETLLKTNQEELREKDEVIQKKNSDTDALNKHISEGKVYIQKMQTRLDDVTEHKAKDELLHKETMESLKSHIQQLEAQKASDDSMHKETVEGLHSRIQEMSAVKTKEYNEHEDIVKKLQANVDEERRNRFELSYQYSQLIQAKQTPKTEMKPSIQETNVESLLLLRQDKEQQTENSHYISELSDGKRPTKLAEEYQELYDNEWTDAFEVLPPKQEEHKVDFLLKLLMRANEICQTMCNGHTNAIKRSFCTIVVNTDPSMEEVCGEVSGRLASDPKGTKQDTGNVQRRPHTKEIIETNFDQTLRNEEKNIVMEIGKRFKQQLSGDLVKIGTEIILKEHKMNPSMASVVAFVKKCMDICWSMCGHVPPLHIDFPDATGDIPLDINKYKPYTKTGQYVHYIVWPAVYLHEGGPLLCKGVAQGKNKQYM